MEYKQGSGAQGTRLSWSSASQSKQVVPSERLLHDSASRDCTSEVSPLTVVFAVGELVNLS